jgi:hypothetical protein
LPVNENGPELPQPSVDVDEDLLRERSKTYIVDHYTVLHNTVASVVLAAAGLSAASLAGSRMQYGSSYPLLWMFWVASFLLCGAIFAGTMVGNLAAPPIMPAIMDLMIPLLLGIGEFVLFGVLAHQVTGLTTTSSVGEAWFISMAVVCISAVAAITRAMRFFGAATYATKISIPIDKYRFERLPADRKGALMVGVIGAGGRGRQRRFGELARVCSRRLCDRGTCVGPARARRVRCGVAHGDTTGAQRQHDTT